LRKRGKCDGATRRSFLGKAAAAAIVTATSRNLWAQDEAAREISKQIGDQTLANATAQMFEQWIGGTFKVRRMGYGQGTLELVKVESEMYPRTKTQHPNDALGEQLNRPEATRLSSAGGAGTVPEVQVTVLWFKRRSKRLQQEVYTVEHDWLGTFDLLLTPSRARTGWTYCFAVITHFTGRMVKES
jgi:hypothetical protein